MAGVALILALFLVLLALLTGVGSARRHDSIGVVIASALGFPIAWVRLVRRGQPRPELARLRKAVPKRSARSIALTVARP